MSTSKHSDPTADDRHVQEPTSVGRYLLFDEIGVGGMAAVHLGLLSGAVGFQRIVAIKQLHPQFVNDPDFCAQFVDEARLAARIHHPNVVQTLDVVWAGDQLALVLEYLDGDTLSRVLKSVQKRDWHVPIEIACGIISGVLHGLHAAHQAKDEQGHPLNIVHRDVSPQNILIGRDGLARVLDFGVARAAARMHNTQAGLIKGKFGYMAPEQVKRAQVDCRTDVFAAGIVLWETLTRQRLFQVQGRVDKVLQYIVSSDAPAPSVHRPEIPAELDAIVLKALQKAPEARFQSAEEFAVGIEEVVGCANPHTVKTWFSDLASDELAERARRIEEINRHYATHPSSRALELGRRGRSWRGSWPPGLDEPELTRRHTLPSLHMPIASTALEEEGPATEISTGNNHTQTVRSLLGEVELGMPEDVDADWAERRALTSLGDSQAPPTTSVEGSRFGIGSRRGRLLVGGAGVLGLASWFALAHIFGGSSASEVAQSSNSPGVSSSAPVLADSTAASTVAAVAGDGSGTREPAAPAASGALPGDESLPGAAAASSSEPAASAESGPDRASAEPRRKSALRKSQRSVSPPPSRNLGLRKHR